MNRLLLCLVLLTSGVALVVQPTQAEPTAQSPLARIGGRLAYVDSDGALLVMASADGSRRPLVSGVNQRIRTPRWSPDGSQIAFAASPRVLGDDEYMLSRRFDIYTVSAQGGGAIKLTDRAANIIDLAWLPDSSKIMYATGFNGNGRIHAVTADGRSDMTFPMPSDDVNAQQTSMSVSPDGMAVAYVQDMPRNTSLGYGTDIQRTIVATDPAGRGARLIANLDEEFIGGELAWSPDGQNIAFANGSQLREVSVNSGQARIIADGGSRMAGSVKYSPDGQNIGASVFPDRSAGWDANLLLLSRSGAQRGYVVNATTPWTSSFAWAPSGSSVLFVRSERTANLISQRYALYLATSAGSNDEFVVGLDYANFDWQP